MPTSDVNRLRLRRLLRDLIDIYSPSGKEADVVDFAEAFLQDRGLCPQRQWVDEERANLFVPPGEGIDAPVLFIGHLDTVPAFDLERFDSSEQDGMIYGLGAADMKGGCAALMEAFVAWREERGDAFPAALALVVGEEENGDGAEKLAEEQIFPWTVVAEPTNLRPALGHYGYIEMLIETAGERRHASFSNREHNAIRVLLDLLQSLVGHLDGARPEVVYNIRDVHSADAGFAVPDRCEAALDVHIPPELVTREVQDELLAVAHETDPSAAVQFGIVHRGYQIEDAGLLPDLLRGLWRGRGWSWSPGVFPSDSDGAVLHAAGSLPIVLGPGRLSRAHSRAEAVHFEQVAAASALYRDLLDALDGGA